MNILLRKGILALALVLLAGAVVFISCQPAEEPDEAVVDLGTVEMTYVEWDCANASTHVMKVVLEEVGYEVELTAVTGAAMYQALATDATDGMVTAWLPVTHGEYWEGVKDQVENLGPLYEGAALGWIVPTYVEIDSVTELNDHADEFDNRIVGIDPGAGLMGLSEEMFEVYDLDNFELIEGSDATMTAALDDAYGNEEWIVVTGWAPHWKFGPYDLKFLDDPEGVLGGEEYIAAMVPNGKRDQYPEFVHVLENFYWTDSQIATVMTWVAEGMDSYEAAQQWVSQNRDVVEQWLPN